MRMLHNPLALSKQSKEQMVSAAHDSGSRPAACSLELWPEQPHLTARTCDWRARVPATEYALLETH